jgi:hypothetical protein
MKEFLRRLAVSGQHLVTLDDFLLVNDAEYQRMEKELDGMGEDYLNFCREVYFGGSKSKGNPPRGSRQMILSDVFQYLMTNRSYYLAAGGSEGRKQFVKIVMYLVNQWLIMDCLGGSEKAILRKQLMRTLKKEIGDDFFEANERYHFQKYDQTLAYDGDLIPKPPNTEPPNGAILDTYDSLFPKIRGGPIEMLVYLYLIQRRLGFVVSLLTQQRLLRRLDGEERAPAPPDLFLLRRKGEVMGLEIGRGKEKQSADFSLLTGIPTFSVDLVGRQPFRCDACGRWIIYCRKVIESYSEGGVPKGHKYVLKCAECSYFDSGHCPDIICYTERENRYGEIRMARYHFRCLSPKEKHVMVREKTGTLEAYYPLVEGLEKFPEE